MDAARLAVVYRPLKSLIPSARNERTHTPEQIGLIADAITRFGWTNPVLVRADGEIVAGHARVLAAERIGFDPVPTITLAHLDDAAAAALRVADNQLTIAGSGWDPDRLRETLGMLRGSGWDLGALGFGPVDIASLFNTRGGLTDPDAAPPAPADPVTRVGDLWVCGRHWLVCGDATNRDAVGELLAAGRRVGKSPNLMVTDPPYGVDYDAFWRARTGLNAAVGPAHGQVTNDHRADWSSAWALFPGDVAYVWHGGLHSMVVENSLSAAGLLVRSQIIWVKTRPVISRGNYHWQHEPALYTVREGAEDDWARFDNDHEVAGYLVRKGGRAGWEGGRKQSTVWFIEHLRSDTGHSTQKPVECMRRPIENNSKAGDAVYDPFLGSGTTMIAAEMTGRCCFGVEVAPAYCDVAVLRWQAFTGQAATLAGSGRTFADEKQARAARAQRTPTRARRRSAA
jgi:DNA modification methylase